MFKSCAFSPLCFFSAFDSTNRTAIGRCYYAEEGTRVVRGGVYADLMSLDTVCVNMNSVRLAPPYAFYSDENMKIHFMCKRLSLDKEIMLKKLCR